MKLAQRLTRLGTETAFTVSAEATRFAAQETKSIRYSGKSQSIAALPGMEERTVITYTYCQSLSHR